MRPQIRSHVSIFIFFVIALVGHVACLAQDTTQIEIQDGVFVRRVINHGADTLPLNANIAAAYIFEREYDSTCRIQYTFTECRINAMRPRLATWKFRQQITAPVSALTDSSRTDPFKVVAGDTITFYRELIWYDSKTGRRDIDNFCSPDTLDYVVELVRWTTGHRTVMLDSLGILARSAPGAPTLYGMRPVMAKVAYVVPRSLDGDTVFVRVRPYVRGHGVGTFVRCDGVGVNRSDALALPFWQAYLSVYGRFGRRISVASDTAIR